MKDGKYEVPHVERNKYDLLDDLMRYVKETRFCGCCPFAFECMNTGQSGRLCVEQEDILHDYLVEKYNL